MSTARRIAVVTGSRAEYGILASVLRAIAAQPRLELQLVVTGIHLLRRFGCTVRQIATDGWRIDARVPMQRGDDDPLDQAQGLARGVTGVAKALQRLNTDAVLVLGDRIEALAGALAATTTGRLVAHVHGGDVAPGDFDDSLRHAITKLAHVHFAATRAAARRIVRLGEQCARVHVVGAPGLDRLRELLAESASRRHSVWHRHPAGEQLNALVVYHAWGRPAATERRVMDRILRVVAGAGLRRMILFPNTDRGHRGVLTAIDAHVRTSAPDDVEVHRSLPRDDYLRALLAADVLIGNSSSGLIEATFAGTPAVNVGGREAGRLAGGRSVIHCDETDAGIRAALRAALRLRVRPGRATVYGDGRAAPRIARVLANLPRAPEFRRKIIAY